MLSLTGQSTYLLVVVVDARYDICTVGREWVCNTSTVAQQLWV